MVTYKAPLDEIGFVLFDVLGYERSIPTLPGFEEAGADLARPVLEEAGRLCEDALFPLNQSGDAEGCTYENGVVRTAERLQASLRRLRPGRLERDWRCRPSTVGRACRRRCTSRSWR